ncbi:16S rRNA (guanine(966)-N(2))-methyltransferase RsmD [Ornithinibacillus halotolerans]|uniref:rRNA methyltransferase YlbH n=1 Tax=Ornithinibacillus halotolerans TaxID=1274357 RepID=A0A916S488_9BACI|nr:16S rRNA (guanine(966)-N(2))-methyltransferase RsmD [Ornithinibacillus halotolerans]GGA83768.1 putative rRNA methyltransferase YlbH [Ornithinibacillus halotolerans]
MRVVAGIHKGRQLKAVPGNNTRPTTDKVKEAVFQIMGPFFDGGTALDLFAGSGSLGIEALSRGMDSCIFVDKHPKAIQTIKENTSLLRLDSHVEIFRTDAYRALHAASKRELRFDLIFLDPPYNKVSYTELIGVIMKEQLLNENGIIYCEHDLRDALPEEISGLAIIKHLNYGGTIGVTIYQ